MDKKSRTLQELVTKTKDKIEILQMRTKMLKTTNYKLEALLNIIEKLSVPDISRVENPEIIYNEFLCGKVDQHENKQTSKDISILKNSNFFDTPFNETIPIVEQQEINTRDNTKWTYEKILEKINDIKNNAKFIKNTHKIVSLLNENSVGLNIENIIKKTGVSKYRCIDIINELTKVKPHILLKKYEDKTYTYYLNI